MKKLSLILVCLLAAIIMNAQATKVQVKPADLPKMAAENVAKTYPGYTIKEVTKVTEKNIIRYDVVVVKGSATETLCYDKNGSFLMKMTPKAATPAPVQKPAEKKAPARK